jgi:pyrroline-5-carboxylate reductase
MEQKSQSRLGVNIGFIGAGNMAKAIGEGLTHSGNKPLHNKLNTETRHNSTFKVIHGISVKVSK